MSTAQYDILVLGATGFTGKLITRYLITHPQNSSFSFAIAGRSNSKLKALVKDLSVPASVRVIQVDISNPNDVESVVKSAKVVINTVGPFWNWGTPVVRACARNGVHYVDLTGESAWIKEIIAKFDYLAMKTGTIIVPSCGFDSIPSDLLAYLGNKTVKSLPNAHDLELQTSTSAFAFKGGVSGGSLGTIINMIENVPREKIIAGSADYSLSPVKGTPSRKFQLVRRLLVPGAETLIGSHFFMEPTNKALVQRTFGLLEWNALSTTADNADRKSQAIKKIVDRERYGPQFNYSEFMITTTPARATILFVGYVLTIFSLAFIPPLRWLVKKLAPQSGEGPSEEAMKKGSLDVTNITIAGRRSPRTSSSSTSETIQVKSTLKGDGDPGYLLSAIMITESALCLLPNVPLPKTANVLSFPSLSSRGGILTPMTAFGDVLIERLRSTGRFEIESTVVGEDRVEKEARKNI